MIYNVALMRVQDKTCLKYSDICFNFKWSFFHDFNYFSLWFHKKTKLKEEKRKLSPERKWAKNLDLGWKNLMITYRFAYNCHYTIEVTADSVDCYFHLKHLVCHLYLAWHRSLSSPWHANWNVPLELLASTCTMNPDSMGQIVEMVLYPLQQR